MRVPYIASALNAQSAAVVIPNQDYHIRSSPFLSPFIPVYCSFEPSLPKSDI